MTKFKIISAMVALAFAATPLIAGDKDGHCAKNAANEGEAACNAISFAHLDLSTDQKSKLNAAKKDCDKSGCTKESKQAFMKTAEGVLSKEQYTKLKAECDKHDHDKKAKTQT